MFKIISFLTKVMFDIWLWVNAFAVVVLGHVLRYSEIELFWLFVLMMIAPVVPLIYFYSKDRLLASFFSILALLILVSLAIVDSDFIPGLPFEDVMIIFIYSFVSVAIGRSQGGYNNAKVWMADVALKILIFFPALFFAPLISKNPESFATNMGEVVLVSVPLYITVAILINLKNDSIEIDK